MLVALLLAGPTASAAPPPHKVDELQAAREHFLKGTRAFELGLYNEAITEYIAAYKAKDDPSILFNLGQSYRLAGRREDALRSYKAYLAKSPEASNRELVQQRMAELQKQLETAKVEPPPVAPAPTPPPPPPPSLATVAAPAALALAISPTPMARRPLFLGGVTLIAVGALALAGGGAAYALAERAGNQLLWRETNGEAYDPSLYAAGQQRALAGTIALGVGGAALLSGAVLTGLAFRSSRSIDGHAIPRLSLTVHPNLVAAQAAFSF